MDVAWHRSIGRASFLTPAQILVYLCGVIAFFACAYLILYTTFASNQRLKAESVFVLGFRARVGAFLATLNASTGYTFHFRLLDPAGKPAADLQPYLGMAGHAAFVKTDGTVFAHTHSDGSAAVADVMAGR